jgi:broad specificity phosphatase PhoE
MRRLIVARHGESEYSARGALNGDPENPCPLTDAGREQARRLGRLLVKEPIDLCATSSFGRAQETAEIALAGRDVPQLVVPDLGDHSAGSYEGGRLADYLEWAHTAPAREPIPGAAESRVDVAARLARGYRALLERPESVVLAVLHALPINYLLVGPQRRLPPLGYAEPKGLEAHEVESAIERLERWAAAPSWSGPPSDEGAAETHLSPRRSDGARRRDPPIAGPVRVSRLTAAAAALCALPLLAGCARAPLAHTCSATDKHFIGTTQTNMDMLGYWSSSLQEGEAQPSEVIRETKNAVIRVTATSPTDPALVQTRQIVRVMLNEYWRAIQAQERNRPAGVHMMRAYGLANFAHDVLTQAEPALASKGCDVAPLL